MKERDKEQIKECEQDLDMQQHLDPESYEASHMQDQTIPVEP